MEISSQVNFGTEDPWCEPLTGYTFVGKVPLEDRVLGTQGPEKREEAEVGLIFSPLFVSFTSCSPTVDIVHQL